MKRGLFVVILSLFVCGTGFAQLAAWNFGPGVKGNEKTSFSTLTDDCLEVSELSRGPGLVPQKATCSFASTWPACNSMLGAVRLGAYYQFSLNAKRGCVVSFDRLLVVLRVQPDALRIAERELLRRRPFLRAVVQQRGGRNLLLPQRRKVPRGDGQRRLLHAERVRQPPVRQAQRREQRISVCHL